MKSETGSLLTKIAAIIDFIAAGILGLVGIVLFSLIMSGVIPDSAKADLSGMPVGSLAGIILLICILIGVLFLVMGLLLYKASKKMLNPKTTRKGSIWAIVIGVITLSNISGILALIGGIIGLSDAGK